MPTETVETKVAQSVEAYLDFKSKSEKFTLSVDKGDFRTLGKSHRFYSEIVEWAETRGFEFEEKSSRGFVFEDGTTLNDPMDRKNIFVFKKL